MSTEYVFDPPVSWEEFRKNMPRGLQIIPKRPDGSDLKYYVGCEFLFLALTHHLPKGEWPRDSCWARQEKDGNVCFEHFGLQGCFLPFAVLLHLHFDSHLCVTYRYPEAAQSFDDELERGLPSFQ